MQWGSASAVTEFNKLEAKCEMEEARGPNP
jgi:hypothetical protein